MATATTTTTAAVAPVTSFGQALQDILNVLKGDTLKVALPVLNQFLASVISNPSQLNIVAQASALQVNLLAALPTLESDVASDVAKILQAQIAGLSA